ncbi:MAG: hypothetical protein WC375_03600 [Methanomassiliicoccales archaeon]
MGIIYYPNRVFKGKSPAIDYLMAQRIPRSVTGFQDITSSGLDHRIYQNTNWVLDAVAFQFNNTVSKTYGFNIVNGRAVVENLNDYLWFWVDGTMPQKIILGSGFYTGTELATELQSKMDANDAYTAANITFSVDYAPSTGLFTITPSDGTIKYLAVNTMTTHQNRDSIAGHLFGLTVNGSSFASSVQSDSPVFGLDQETVLLSSTSSTADHYHDDTHVLTMDQAVRLTTNTAASTVTYTIEYEGIA